MLMLIYVNMLMLIYMLMLRYVNIGYDHVKYVDIDIQMLRFVDLEICCCLNMLLLVIHEICGERNRTLNFFDHKFLTIRTGPLTLLFQNNFLKK